MYTNHALCRAKQRGISHDVVEAVIDFGVEFHKGGGHVYLCTKVSETGMTENGISSQFASRCRGVYVVIQDGAVKTVAHKYKRFKH